MYSVLLEPEPRLVALPSVADQFTVHPAHVDMLSGPLRHTGERVTVIVVLAELFDRNVPATYPPPYGTYLINSVPLGIPVAAGAFPELRYTLTTCRSLIGIFPVISKAARVGCV